MSDTPNLVRAIGPNGTERDVPAHWLDKDRSPFPGRWKAAPKAEAAPKGVAVSAVAGDGAEDPSTIKTTTSKGA